MLSNTVLIVDDDEAVVHMLQKVANSEGLESMVATNGMEAVAMLDEKEFALMLLDINMPKMTGFEVIEKIRKDKIDVPIMVISGRKEDFDTLYALEIGADEYITKPFNPVTLGAKIKALIRRSQATEAPASTKIVAGPFTYDMRNLKLYKNNQEIILTSKENILMKMFMESVNRVFTKEALSETVWENSDIESNVITVYINRLRQKIEDDPTNPKFIQTARGLGYRFVVKNKAK